MEPGWGLPPAAPRAAEPGWGLPLALTSDGRGAVFYLSLVLLGGGVGTRVLSLGRGLGVPSLSVPPLHQGSPGQALCCTHGLSGGLRPCAWGKPAEG